MFEQQSHLTFEVARCLANEAAAEHGSKHFAPRNVPNFLSDCYLEAEGCWIFFPMASIDAPETHWHLHKFAVAVSKSGEVRIVYDFRENAQKMQAYLEVISLHSLGRMAQSRAAMDAFQRQYPGSRTDQ